MKYVLCLFFYFDLKKKKKQKHNVLTLTSKIKFLLLNIVSECVRIVKAAFKTIFLVQKKKCSSWIK